MTDSITSILKLMKMLQMNERGFKYIKSSILLFIKKEWCRSPASSHACTGYRWRGCQRSSLAYGLIAPQAQTQNGSSAVMIREEMGVGKNDVEVIKTNSDIFLDND